MNEPQELCGLFGKAPQQSDFINHHLPEDVTEHWHRWLQSSLSISREQLGEQWLNTYLISPIWHFAIMPKVIGEQAVLGVMIPSVDQVGRYFPLTIAHTGPHQIWSAYLNGQSWFDQIEKVALYALADNTSYSQLLGELESLDIPTIPNMPAYVSQSSVNAFNHNQIIHHQSPDQSTNDLALSLLNNAYQQQLGNHSLWWTKGSSTIKPCLAISSNLPDPGQFAAMLDGNWQQWGWSEESIVENNPQAVSA